jgi:hypothetical protein
VHITENGGELATVINNLSPIFFFFWPLFNRRPPSPESPKPYQSSPRPTSSLFPEAEDDPLRLEGLPDYIRDFNKTHQSKLHIWTRGARSSDQLTPPVVVRFTVHDVVTMFISLGHGPDLSTLVIETVTAFGPRETVKLKLSMAGTSTCS